MENENLENIARDDLALVSMGVILHAGNARELVFEAVNAAAGGDFIRADERIITANQEFVEAHRAQTETLQKEAEGIEIPYSALFGHAQDTLMTVKSEYSLVKEIIKLYKRLDEKK